MKNNYALKELYIIINMICEIQTIYDDYSKSVKCIRFGEFEGIIGNLNYEKLLRLKSQNF